MQKALEQTAEKAVGLQPLVAHLSDALKEAHKHSHSTQTQSEQTCYAVWPTHTTCSALLSGSSARRRQSKTCQRLPVWPAPSPFSTVCTCDLPDCVQQLTSHSVFNAGPTTLAKLKADCMASQNDTCAASTQVPFHQCIQSACCCSCMS